MQNEKKTKQKNNNNSNKKEYYDQLYPKNLRSHEF